MTHILPSICSWHRRAGPSYFVALIRAQLLGFLQHSILMFSELNISGVAQVIQTR